jgi:hypothetical protein
MTFEEWDHVLLQRSYAGDSKCPYGAVRAFGTDSAAPKKADQLVEHMSIITVLIDLKDWQYLPTLSLPNKRISMEADREATFPVNETNDPRCIEQPRPCSFLLIVPTCHVFTAHNHSL